MTPRKEVIGECELWLGDCREVLPMVGVVDHIITDPPYEAVLHNMNKKLSVGRQLKDKRNPFNLFDFSSIEDLREPFLANINARGWLIAFCIAEGIYPWEQAIKRAGHKYKRPCLWIKPDGMPQFNGQCPGLGFECFVTAWCGPGHSKWNGGGKHGVYIFPKGMKQSTHPTEKPISLMSSILVDFTNYGQTICDPFLGSGSTGVACVNLGRKFIGIELEEKYFDIARRRIEKAYQQPRLFEEPAPKPKQEALL